MNDSHQAFWKEWDAKIRVTGGGECSERVCIMPTRRIEPNLDWHLTHDHVKGGPDDYLGPARREFNMYEAMERGHVWRGAPTLEELLEGVRNPKAVD